MLEAALLYLIFTLLGKMQFTKGGLLLGGVGGRVGPVGLLGGIGCRPGFGVCHGIGRGLCGLDLGLGLQIGLRGGVLTRHGGHGHTTCKAECQKQG